ncbi:hypothetical protein [Arthrobacter sp. A5]|uniref:hypothetical protein n=1 Tax=Arthrobacter sp. A5 TaxID=576926 RepID=UPI003DA931B4
MLQLIVLATVPFIWFGMVAAISFLETPLKFRAPGITVALGVEIGRIVFKALNTIECLFAVVLVLALVAGPHVVPVPAGVAIGVAVLALALQLVVLRPNMAQRTRLLADSAAAGGRTAADARNGGTGTLQGIDRTDVATVAANAGAKTATAPHLSYIAAEVVKFAALPVAGIAILLAAI